MQTLILKYINAEHGLEARIYFHGDEHAFPYTVEFWDTDANESAFAKRLTELERAQAFGRAFCGENRIAETLNV